MFDASIIMANALLHDATTQKTAVEIFAALWSAYHSLRYIFDKNYLHI
jgi:hypothetical protein